MLTPQDNHRINKVGKICESIKKLTKADFAAVQKLCDEQKQHVHPLKTGSQMKINDMGKQNERIKNALVAAQEEIKALEPIMKRKIIKL